MPRNIGFSLVGKPAPKSISLVGNSSQFINSSNDNTYVPSEINLLKINIMNTLIIPFHAKNWKVLEENLVFIDIIKDKLLTYVTRYPDVNLELYSELVEACETTIYLNMQVLNLENRLYGLGKSTANIMVRTAMLRLRPELELYHLILGRPDKKLGETYDKGTLNKMKELLTIENITYDQIKNAFQ